MENDPGKGSSSEVHDLILEDLDYGASCVTDARDRLVSLDVNRLFDEAEERDADLGDFDMLEAQHIRKVDEEFRKVLNQTLGISSTVCDQLLKTKTRVDQPQVRTNPTSKPGESLYSARAGRALPIESLLWILKN